MESFIPGLLWTLKNNYLINPDSIVILSSWMIGLCHCWLVCCFGFCGFVLVKIWMPQISCTNLVFLVLNLQYASIILIPLLVCYSEITQCFLFMQSYKCIAINWPLTMTIVAVRSVLDFIYFLNILLQVDSSPSLEALSFFDIRIVSFFVVFLLLMNCLVISITSRTPLV